MDSLTGRCLLRGAAVAVTVLAAAAPALAQVTLRIDPVPVEFGTTTPPPSFTTFDVYMDGVPSGGIGAFAIILNEDESEFRKCLDFEAVALDPALVTAWGANNSISSVSNDILMWTANSLTTGTSPAGTVKLGTITYEVLPDSNPNTNTPNCALGTQNVFRWEPASRWSPTQSASPGFPFDSLIGSPWVIGPPPDIDLTVSCTRVMAPNDDPAFYDPGVFVDGQTVQLDCTVSNLGTAPTTGTVSSTLVSRFSDDLVIDGGDSAIGQADGVTVGAGGMVSRTITATPFFTTPKDTNICAKIDVDTSDLNNAGGTVLETDETNNVDCDPVTVASPQKDLVIDPNFVDPNLVDPNLHDPNLTDPNDIDVLVTPSSVDPNALHAGLTFQVSYAVRNQGAGAVRTSYRNTVHLGTSLAAIQANPNGTRRCGKLQELSGSVFHKGRTSLTQTFGLDPDPANDSIPADPNEVCQIPFTLPAGDYVLAVRTDALNNVTEEDPNGLPAPAEANNWTSLPLRVEAALPPEFRVREGTSPGIPVRINDLDVLIYDPPNASAPGLAAISLISAQNVGSYSLTLSWDPNLTAVSDPNIDPNAILFTDFLQENGRDQDCDIDNLDQSAGVLSVSCTTSCNDPNVSCAGATTEGHSTLLTAQFEPVFPGNGNLTLSNITAANPLGGPISQNPLRITNGTFTVTGDPKLRVINAVPPAGIVPGFPFSTSYDIENSGFGAAPTPILSRLILSRDANMTIPPDVIACAVNETSPIGGLTTRNKSLTTCRLLDDAIPGSYTGFYQVDPTGFGTDPNNWDVVTLPVPSRIVTLRKSGKGRIVETYLEPDPNGTTGAALASSRFSTLGVSVVGSESRSLNWMVGMKASSSGPRKLQLRPLPKSQGEALDVLTSLRLPKQTRKVLSGIDVDGDGQDELILLNSVKGSGDVLDMRRIDFTQRKPLICQSAAVTLPFAAGVVDAAGIEYDGDTTSDELAVVTGDGVLTIYDLTLTGSPPPPSPCLAVPSTIHENPADVDLVPLASDTGFGAPGDQVLSLCVLDFALDGTPMMPNEQLAALFEDASGLQALRIYDAPASLGGTATLLAEDAAFGGTQSRARAMAIACTR